MRQWHKAETVYSAMCTVKHLSDAGARQTARQATPGLRFLSQPVPFQKLFFLCTCKMLKHVPLKTVPNMAKSLPERAITTTSKRVTKTRQYDLLRLASKSLIYLM